MLSTAAVFTSFSVKREESVKENNNKSKQLSRMLPFKIHLFITIVAAITVMHVQVVTRFVCASSPIFL